MMQRFAFAFLLLGMLLALPAAAKRQLKTKPALNLPDGLRRVNSAKSLIRVV